MMIDKEKYRSNEFPPEIEDLMVVVVKLAKDLDRLSENKSDPGFIACFEEYNKAIAFLKKRSKYYYDKRKNDFGIMHMRLKRLVDSCDSLFVNS